jgi:AraC-like DNA-binding protein
MPVPAAKPPTFSWDASSDGWAGAYDRYHQSMADMYDVSDVPDGGRTGFMNRTSVTLFENGTIGRGRSVTQTLRRTPAQIRRSNLDTISLIVNRAGMVADCNGVDVRAAPGTVNFRDMALPSAGRLDSIDLVNLQTPREIAPAWMLDGVHGLMLPADSAVGRLLANHLSTLAEVASELSAEDGVAAIEAAFVIAERAMGRIKPSTPSQSEAIYRTVRHRATRAIERRLLDPTLTVDAVAVDAGASRTTLYRAFADHGGVQRRIQTLRLERARTALRRRIGRSPTVSEIAYGHGFASEAHFGRLFRARFGHAPSETPPGVRSIDRGRSAATPDIAHDAIVDWLRQSRSG